VVLGLGICPSVCFSQILQSSDEIRSGNGVLALGTKEFRNFVLLYSEIEICGPVSSSTWCGGHIDVTLAGRVAGIVVISGDVDIVVVVVLGSQINVVGSSDGSRHFRCV
jgi:hypothetical protein